MTRTRRSTSRSVQNLEAERDALPKWLIGVIGIVAGGILPLIISILDAHSRSGADRNNFVRSERYETYSHVKADSQRIFFLVQGLTDKPAYVRDRAQLMTEQKNVFVDFGALSIIGSEDVTASCSKVANGYFTMFTTIDDYYKTNTGSILNTYADNLQELATDLQACSNAMRKDVTR